MLLHSNYNRKTREMFNLTHPKIDKKIINWGDLRDEMSHPAVPVQVLSTLGFLATGALSARALGQVQYFTAHHQQDNVSSLSGYHVSFQTIPCFSL